MADLPIPHEDDMMTDRPPYFISTAIAYPNGAPHIGHAYEAIATDVIARFRRQAGYDVRFVTGIDEHGLKMEQTARKMGISAAQLADRMAPQFLEMTRRFNISQDDFIRTSEQRHAVSVQELWRRMAQAGDIFLDKYEGWYSVRDEAFYDESELVDGPEGEGRLSPQGTPVEWTVEETFFFRLSAYQERLLEHYRSHPDFIQPRSRSNEVVSFVEGGLKDLSISRTSFSWGVPVPDAPGHVMYVWVDALTNYLTSAGFPDEQSELFRRFWPADLHVIGKDITRFHAVYWPAFLMSAGVALPRQVFAHGFLFNRGEKMSKSVGNVISPDTLANLYGVDPVRYFLLREVSFGQDGSYSHEAIVTRANAELANSYGNLAQRILSFIAKNLDGIVPLVSQSLLPEDMALADAVQGAVSQQRQAFMALDLSGGIEAWMRGVYSCNQYIDAQAPWALRKTDPERMAQVLGLLYDQIIRLTLAIQPVIPAAATRLLDHMGVPANQRTDMAADGAGPYRAAREGSFRLAVLQPIFPRLELPADLTSDDS